MCWRLQLSELEFDVVKGAGMKQQADRALSRLMPSRTDQIRIEDEKLLLLITSLIPPDKEEARPMYMQN